MTELKKTKLILILLSLQWLAACGQKETYMNSGLPSDRVVDGTDVTFEDPVYRRVLSLKTTYNKSNDKDEVVASTIQCSASAIAPRIILTAAHCLRDETTYQRIEYKTPQGLQEFKVLKSIGHPLFKENNVNDVAVLLLAKDLPAEIEILNLPTTDDSLPEMIEAAGYGRNDGRVNSATPGAGKLRKKTLRLGQSPSHKPTFIVEQSEGGACQGDSGSPAMAEINGKVIVFGVLARTLSAVSEAPDRDLCRSRAEYTQVISFIDFIEEAAAKLDSTIP